MYSNKDVWDFISKNKPQNPNLLNLKLSLFLGYLKNQQTWISQQQYDNTIGVTAIPWQAVSVSISIDQQCVYQGAPTDTHSIVYQIPDNTENQHNIAIKLSGLTDSHRPRWPLDNSYGGVALQITGTVEHIPFQLLTSTFGEYQTDSGQINVATEVMGQNGTQQLYFDSPFYKWLHQRRNKIIGQLTYPSSK